MKGTVLDFSVQKGEGIISGDNNQRYTFKGEEWKSSEPPLRGTRVDFDARDVTAVGIYRELSQNAVAQAQEIADFNLTGLSPYYQEEFRKIHDSNESYKGKWNWDAFIWGVFWALSKGLWGSVLLAVALGLVTGGLVLIGYWFVWGIRGNYIYYTLHVKKKQILA